MQLQDHEGDLPNARGAEQWVGGVMKGLRYLFHEYLSVSPLALLILPLHREGIAFYIDQNICLHCPVNDLSI